MGNKRLPNLCDLDTCTGCSSCAQSCPVNAIDMKLNSEGYYIPFVNSDKCIRCLQCEKSCPIITPILKNKQRPQASAAWNKNETIRQDSSSGGIFSGISEVVLQSGGVVWGAGFDERMSLVYQCVENSDDLHKIRRSKYIQGYVGNAFKQIREQLKSGKKVLFCGTPCHVAGLYAFLKGKDLDNLLAVDFICHGVPSSKLFQNYIHWLENKYKDKIVDFNFREKRFGINYNVGTSASFLNIGKKFLYLSDNSYTLGFCKDKTIHNVCAQCSFRNIQRPADITIGDFHSSKTMYSFMDQYKGISCIIVNSKKGEEILRTMEFEMKTISIDEIISSNPSYSRNSDLKSLNLKEIIEMPYDRVRSLYFAPNLRDKIKTYTVRILGGRISYFLRNYL